MASAFHLTAVLDSLSKGFSFPGLTGDLTAPHWFPAASALSTAMPVLCPADSTTSHLLPGQFIAKLDHSSFLVSLHPQLPNASYTLHPPTSLDGSDLPSLKSVLRSLPTY